MAAVHDMGGRTEFFGPVVEEANEPVFHQPWEGRVFGMAMSLMPLLGRNVDAFRLAQERLPRDVYLSSYYRRWLAGLERRLVEAGLLGPKEVDARLDGRTAQAGPRRISAVRRAATSRGLRFLLRPQLPRWVAGHTRRPAYVTGKPGVVVAHLGNE